MASPFYLEFEKPIVELEKKIEELNSLASPRAWISPQMLQIWKTTSSRCATTSSPT